MVKVLPKLYTSASRYLTKNTVRSRYNRHMDGAMWSGTAAIIHALNMKMWVPHDVVINCGLWGTYMANTAAAIKNRIEMQPIIKRAKLIKKAAKNAGHKIGQK